MPVVSSEAYRFEEAESIAQIRSRVTVEFPTHSIRIPWPEAGLSWYATSVDQRSASAASCLSYFDISLRNRDRTGGVLPSYPPGVILSSLQLSKRRALAVGVGSGLKWGYISSLVASYRVQSGCCRVVANSRFPSERHRRPIARPLEPRTCACQISALYNP